MAHLGIELDKLPPGRNIQCDNCKEITTVFDGGAYIYFPVSESEFYEGLICQCGQHFNFIRR